MGKLVLFRADGAAQDIRLDRERITIGRRPDNDVCLAQPAVSGEHAAVVTILSDSFLEDLRSTNGTLVNGIRINRHVLSDGDEIDIGRQVLVYVVDDSATLEAPPSRSGGTKDRTDADGNVAAAAPATAAALVASAAKHNQRPPGSPVAVPEAPGDPMRRPVALDDDRETDVAEATLVDGSRVAAKSPASPALEASPEIRVLSGANAGRSIALVKRETLVGRAGIQVAALRLDAGHVLLVPIEGLVPPSVNGKPVAPDGTRLAAGDLLEIAGTRLELVLPRSAGG